jgi:two-component system invasion response regulator UvrY
LKFFSSIDGGKKLISIAEELSITLGTVSAHRTRIIKKFNMESNADLLSYSISSGLINKSTI